ncbi:MAG: dihydrolipoyl dehydrogenase [Deltaproteobacteria bacterium]|nr:dihydrolipoyl dehydrogenase [Deltaproteobacteria bacterium]
MSTKPALQVDVAIIGSGTAGVVAHSLAVRNGAKRVVMIEDGPYGTMCARVGCMPSKALIAAAHAAEAIRHAPTFGVHGGDGPSIDPVAVLKRVQTERTRLSGDEIARIDRMPDEQKLRGTARFIAPGKLVVTKGDETIEVEARAIVLATGSRPWIPDVLKGLGDRLIDNEGLFALSQLPASLAVVGAGVIGMELGQACHRLGVRTSFLSLFPHHRIGGATDPVIQDKLHELFGAELDLHLPARLSRAVREGDEVALTWDDADGTTHNARFERVFVATGRQPRVAELDLAQAGIPLDEHGVPRFDPDTMQCGDSSVFVAGDVTGKRLIQHEAAAEGRVAGRNAARFPEIERVPYRSAMAVVFTDPEIAFCGLRYADLKAEKKDFAIGEVNLAKQTRLQVMNQARGHLRLYGDRDTKKLIGAEIVGPDAEHLAHLITWAIELDLTVSRMLSLPFYHPTVEEGLRAALVSLNRAFKS